MHSSVESATRTEHAMSRRLMTLTALALTLAGTSACDEVPEAAFGAGDAVALRPSSGGILLNTSASGEWAIDHLDTNFGTSLDKVSLDAIVLQDVMEKGMTVKLDAVWTEKGELHGKSKYGEHKGDDFLNSIWYLATPAASGATNRQMTISEHNIDAAGFHRYVFLYPNDPAYGWHIYTLQGGGIKNVGEKTEEKPPENIALCAPDPETNGSIEAFVFGDLYVDMKNGKMTDRKDTLMLACVSGGVGKAGGLWEYAPFAYGVDVLEAGTRMVRADYCGDGTSYTKPGNQLYAKDVFGVHDFGQGAGNVTEAIWTREGAACLDTPRDGAYSYADVDCGGWTPMWCKDLEMSDFGPDAVMHSKAP